MDGFVVLTLAVVFFALVGCAWWLGTLGSADSRREPLTPVYRPPESSGSLVPRRVVVMNQGEDGVFR